MRVTVYVRDYRGETLLSGSVDVRGILVAAAKHGSPMLSGVDEYDDTTFNRTQSILLGAELNTLTALLGDDLSDAARSLKAAPALSTRHRIATWCSTEIDR